MNKKIQKRRKRSNATGVAPRRKVQSGKPTPIIAQGPDAHVSATKVGRSNQAKVASFSTLLDQDARFKVVAKGQPPQYYFTAEAAAIYAAKAATVDNPSITIDRDNPTCASATLLGEWEWRIPSPDAKDFFHVYIKPSLWNRLRRWLGSLENRLIGPPLR